MFAIFMALACTTDEPNVDDSVVVNGADLSFYADVKPVLDVHCTRCHFEEGLGVGDFTDPDTVTAFAEVMLGQIDAGAMPPPVSDTDCHDYRGSGQLNIDDSERKILSDWIDGGKVMGDPSEDPQVVPTSGVLSDPDMVLMMPEVYTPTWSDAENPGNEYRCFVLDPELEEDAWFEAMAPEVDNEALVHHVVLFSESRSGLSEEQKDPQGWNCIDDSGAGDGMIAGWAPGMLPVEFPENTGMKLGADKVLVLQMHYYQSGPETVADRSGYAFRTKPASEVEEEVIMFPLGLYSFNVPAGDADYTDSDSFENTYPVTLKIHGVFPHMHVLGQSYGASINHADGSETCIVEGEYDFDNQLTYQFAEDDTPLVSYGDSIEFFCNWNNSTSNPDLPYSEPIDAGYGERTDEEMCFFFSLVSYY
ncbi:MAG: hypothetical protein ACI9VR_001177 [Cognaticolwellia sp.]|jgi:hypothetical protein